MKNLLPTFMLGISIGIFFQFLHQKKMGKRGKKSFICSNCGGIVQYAEELTCPSCGEPERRRNHDRHTYLHKDI